MKLTPRFALAVALVVAPYAVRADMATDMIKEAQAALQRGDVASAKAKLDTVRSINPRHPAALALLKQIAAQQDTGGSTEAQLSRLMVPRIEFKDAQLSAVLGALRQQGEKLSGGKVVPNFVAQLPPEQANTSISLQLSNVPFTEVLKYVGTLAQVSFTFDKYAILVRPASEAAK